MPVFTAKLTTVFEVLQGDQFSLGGRTVVYHISTAKLVGADKYAGTAGIISAGVSGYLLPIAPLGVSATAMLTYLTLDPPADVRINSPSDTVFLSGVQMLPLAGHISSLYLSTGDADTTWHLEVAGGSNAELTTSLPLS